MPTYSYACTECGHRFDAVQAFTDDALTSCPQCSGRLRKLFGSVGVVFKGSGFYRTDSRAAATSTVNGSGKNGAKEGAKEGSGTKAADSSTGSSDKAASASSASPSTAAAAN